MQVLLHKILLSTTLAGMNMSDNTAAILRNSKQIIVRFSLQVKLQGKVKLVTAGCNRSAVRYLWATGLICWSSMHFHCKLSEINSD